MKNPTSLTCDESGNAVLTLSKQEMHQLFWDALMRCSDNHQSACNIYQDWSGQSPEVQAAANRCDLLLHFTEVLKKEDEK